MDPVGVAAERPAALAQLSNIQAQSATHGYVSQGQTNYILCEIRNTVFAVIFMKASTAGLSQSKSLVML